MTDGLAPKRQRFGNHDDLVSVPVPDISSASENTTQTLFFFFGKKKTLYGLNVAAPDSHFQSLRATVKVRVPQEKKTRQMCCAFKKGGSPKEMLVIFLIHLSASFIN